MTVLSTVFWRNFLQVGEILQTATLVLAKYRYLHDRWMTLISYDSDVASLNVFVCTHTHNNTRPLFPLSYTHKHTFARHTNQLLSIQFTLASQKHENCKNN